MYGCCKKNVNSRPICFRLALRCGAPLHSAPHTGGQAALLFCWGRENIASDDIHPPTRLVALFCSLLLFVVSLTAVGIVLYVYIHPADVPTEASQPGAGEGHAPARVRGTLPYHQVRHAAMRYAQGLLANRIIYIDHPFPLPPPPSPLFFPPIVYP